jgi:hypothetical protein
LVRKDSFTARTSTAPRHRGGWWNPSGRAVVQRERVRERDSSSSSSNGRPAVGEY